METLMVHLNNYEKYLELKVQQIVGVYRKRMTNTCKLNKRMDVGKNYNLYFEVRHKFLP